MAFHSLVKRRLRSWLTILGIVIGVAAVVALVSIGEGFEKSIEDQLGGFGGDLIFVSPQHTRGGQNFGGGPTVGDDFTTGGVISGNLTENDLRQVKYIQGIYVATGLLNRPAKIKVGAETADINVQGADPAVQKVFSTILLEEGRYLLAGDDRVAVVGYNVGNVLFKDKLKLNSAILVNGQSVRVVGIFKQSGPAAPTDDLVVLPMVTARRIFSDFPKEQYSSFAIKVSEGADPDEIAKTIEKRLLVAHHVTPDTQDFTVMTSKSVLETIGQILNSTKLFLGGIAAISLLVGGIGIANTMFMSVLERTRQIGILKALGATNAEVMKLFLTESGIMGLFGGIFGVLLGYGVSTLLSGLSFGPGSEGLQTVVTPALAIYSVSFAVLIGILSGILPARKAAKLQPIEALRYE